MEPELDLILFEKPNSNDQEIFEIKKKNAVIVRNATETHMSSSKVKLKNIVDYKWELKHYTGRLVAAHKEGNVIAYAIKANNNGKFEGMIRVVNVDNGKRTLLKGMNSEALDLEFAFLKDPILLAYINESTLYVQKIEESVDKLESSIIFQLEDIIDHTITNDKVTWCPYLPESTFESDVYASQLLTWSRGTTFHCYSISDITWKYGSGPHKASGIIEGGLKFSELKSNILDIGFSPDGTTLATSTEDGYVRFYQVYLHSLDGTPRRLHEWVPHDGKPVQKIMFLDNLNQATTDEPLWKNAITYSEEKFEIKLWCCETWNCLQSIVFKNLADIPLHLKLGMDKTASYMLVSDMYDQQLYVFNIEKSSIKMSEKTRQQTCIKTVAKFPLASQILSFDIVSATDRRYKCGLSDAYLSNEIDDYDDDNNSIYCVILKMFFVQPKSVQECNILYQPSPKSLEYNTCSSDETDNNAKNENVSGKSSPSMEVEKILNDVEVYERYFDPTTEVLTSKSEELEQSIEKECEIEPIVKPKEIIHNSTEHEDMSLSDLKSLISQQSQQLNEIKGALIRMQKNMDVVNEQNQTTVYKQMDQAKSEIVQQVTEKLQLNFNTLGETSINRMEKNVTTKIEKVSNEIQNELKLVLQDKFSGKNIIDDQFKKLTEYIKNDLNLMLKHILQTQIETRLIPAFESSSKELLAELSKTMITGLQSYSKILEKHAKLDKSENSDQWATKSQEQLVKTEEILKLNTAALTREIKHMESHITKVLTEQIKHQVQKQFQEQTSAIQSSVLSVVRSQTPLPSSQDIQINICRLLEQGQINKAFHLALIANDLSLVEFTIKKADFASVFQPCSLEQTVLLSLIQQLSADMQNHSEIKQKYLAEAIINLNLNDSSIKEHAPRIMNELRLNCQNFIKDNPSSYLTSYVKMLIMASQSVA